MRVMHCHSLCSESRVVGEGVDGANPGWLSHMQGGSRGGYSCYKLCSMTRGCVTKPGMQCMWRRRMVCPTTNPHRSPMQP